MLRAQFCKEGNAIWISHLDLMRVLQRSFRRAGLLLKHSQGFTPHPALSLALPLSVGVASQCEIMDFELEDEESVDVSTLAERLNAVLPEGIHIYEVYREGAKVRELSLLKVELRMEYDRGIPEDLERVLAQYFSRDEILMEKKTKSGAMVTQNIREMIKQIVIAPSLHYENTEELQLIICAQNPSLNPAQVVAAISRDLPDYAPDFCAIRRLAVLNDRLEVFQ